MSNAYCPVCDSAFGLVYDPAYPPPHILDQIIKFVCQDCKAQVVHDSYKKTWDVYDIVTQKNKIKQITAEEVAETIEETLVKSTFKIDDPALTFPERIEFRRVGSWKNAVLLCSQAIISKYKVVER